MVVGRKRGKLAFLLVFNAVRKAGDWGDRKLSFI